MLNQFYNYLAKELLHFLKVSEIQQGDRFYLILNNNKELNNLKKAIRFTDGDSKIFKSQEFNYETFYHDLNDKKVIFVCADEGITHDFLVTVRNRISLQKNEWNNSSVVFLIKDDLDSITGGAFDLTKKGAPFHSESLRNNLFRILDSKDTKLSKHETEILKFIVNRNFEDDLVKYTLMDFESVYSIIEQGKIEDDDYLNLGIFKDKQIHTYPSAKEIEARLDENKKLFESIQSIHDRGNVKEQIEENFEGDVVKSLEKNDWFETEFEAVKRSKDASDERKKVIMDFLEQDFLEQFKGLEVWDKPAGNTKTKRRERNIVIFKNFQNLKRIILPFSKNADIDQKNVVAYGRKLLNITNNTKVNIDFGKSNKSNLVLNTEKLDPLKEYYFEFTYKHNNDNSLKFKFRILLVNFEEEKIENIKTKYSLKFDNKNSIIEFNISGVESLLELNHLKNEVRLVQDVGERCSINQYAKYDFNYLIKKEENDLHIDVIINEVTYKLRLKEVLNKPVPISSSALIKSIYTQRTSGIFDENMAKVGTDEYYLFNDFKEDILLEEIIIREKFVAGTFEDGGFNGLHLHLDQSVVDAYTHFCDLLMTKSTLPSLVYYDKEIIEAGENYCQAVEMQLSNINDNEKVTDEKILNIHELGIIRKDNKLYFTALHPLIVKYEIEKTKAFSDEEINEKVFKKYNAASLLPYFVDTQNNYYFSGVAEENSRWLVYKPFQTSNKMNFEKMRFIIKTRLYDFKTHFNYLFSVNPRFSLKVKFLKINDKKVIIQGIIDYILEELKQVNSLEKINAIDIYLEQETDLDEFYSIYNISSYEDLAQFYDIIVPTKVTRKFEEDDVIETLKQKISIYNAIKDTLYHITFLNFNQEPIFSFNNLDEIEASVSNKGLLSNISYTRLGDTYLSGFGTKGINKNYPLIRTAILWNSFASSNQNHHLNPYKRNEGIFNNVTSIEKQDLNGVFNSTNWVTFLDPSVDLSYFNDEKYDLFVIHYNDQTSSFNYESITVTNKTQQYSNILKEFLNKVNVNYEPRNIENIIRSFNILNGEWLLNVIGNKSSRSQDSNNLVREKLSIISAYKQVLAILDNEFIKWIPISLEEILRVSRQQGLESSSDIFSTKELNHKGSISDDLLFIGLEYNGENSSVHFLPVEVKVGNNDSSVVLKAKEQIQHLYKLLKNEIIIPSENKLTQDYYRQFFLNLYFGNMKKFIENGVINDKSYIDIFEARAHILNSEIEYTSFINETYGKGIAIFFTKTNSFRKILTDSSKNIIEVHFTEIDAYEDAEKPLEKVKLEMIQGVKGLDLKILLSNNLNSRNTKFEENFEEQLQMDTVNNEEKVYDGSKGIEHNVIHDESASPIINIPEAQNIIGNDIDELNQIRIPLGNIKGSNQKLYWEYGHPQLPNRHLLISGKSGQGKTYFMQCLLFEMAKVNIDSLVIDYTDGFLEAHLENEFIESLGEKVVTKYIYRDKIPINPFKKKEIDLGGFKMPEVNDDVADRIVQNIDFVFSLGIQQSSLLKSYIIDGLNAYGDNLTFTILKNRLIDSEDNMALKLVGRIGKLLDKDPFIYDDNDFTWKEIFNRQGKVNIFQLKGFVSDIQKIITEFILWDVYNFTEREGNKNLPIPVLLDEMQNLNHKDNSPTTKILKEGRKFGWSSWLATQSITSIKNSRGDISSLFNAAQQIHFAPPEDQITFISKNLTPDINKRRQLENDLSMLNKGECIVNGYAIVDGELKKVIETIEISPLSER